MKAERVAERQAKARLKKGARPLAEIQAERLAMGRQALALRASEGLTRAQLCARLGVKPSQLDKAMQEAKAQPAPPIAKPKTAAQPYRRASRTPSRYVAIVPVEPCALEAGQAPTYNPGVRAKAPPYEDTRLVASERIGGPLHVRAMGA